MNGTLASADTEPGQFDRAELALPMLRERVRLLAEQSAGAAASTVIGALLIGAVLATDLSTAYVALWVLSYLGPAAWRIRFSSEVLAGKHEASTAVLRCYLGLAIFNGLWTGALPLAFFSELSIEARVALTALMLLALSAGAATFASFRAGYLCVLGLAMPPLIYAWARFGGDRSWIVVATLVVFSALMVRLSRTLADVFERSVVIRFERERVVEQLRLEKQHTEAERQRAEHERQIADIERHKAQQESQRAEVERQKAEVERHKAEEANRAKSRFLANASHDLRQPAHALGLFTGVLEQTAQTQQHRDIARNIAAASRVMGELLDNLLDISRLDAGIVTVSPHPVALAPLVERLQADAEREANGSPVTVTAHADDLVVLLDPVLVERALRNLLENALKFTAKGRVHLSALAKGDWLEFRVEDTGCGIEREQHERIFEEFYQVSNAERDRRKGLGLGLSIVARLTALMGGTVQLRSEPGHGTEFTLRLPLTRIHSGSWAPPIPLPAQVDLDGWRVLVIDDEAMVRAGMRDLLASWGAAVDEADGLAQALAVAGQPAAPAWQLCLCDLRLRGGEDGIESARRLRALLPRLPIVLITGDTAPHRIEQATDSGFPLLHKPVTPAQLALTIRRLASQ